jgi:hypothetical protein
MDSEPAVLRCCLARGGGARQLLGLEDGFSRVEFFAHDPAITNKSLNGARRLHIRRDSGNVSAFHAANITPGIGPVGALSFPAGSDTTQSTAPRFLSMYVSSSAMVVIGSSLGFGRKDNSLIPAPAFAFGLALQGGDGLRLGHMPFVHHAPARADAAPCLHDGKTAEQLRLHVERIEPAHIARRIDAVEGYGCHAGRLIDGLRTKLIKRSCARTYHELIRDARRKTRAARRHRGQTATGPLVSLENAPACGMSARRGKTIMAAPSGAIRQWQALPFPLRLAGMFLAFMAVSWLTPWLGGISVLVALLLWCAVGIGLVHASGRLAWVDRYPWVARILEGFAPRFAFGLPSVARSAAYAPAPPHPVEARERPPSPRIECGGGSAPPVAVDLARFVGLDGVFADIDELAATRAGLIRPVAPATLVLLVGPRGTGKSSVALALVAKLHRAGALSSDRIVGIAPTELHGLGCSYGPSDDVLKGVSDRIQAALDGALLIDDLDWLAAGAGGQAAAEVGNRVLAVARRYPGRLFVIGTGSGAAIGRLDPANRWLSHLHVRRIDFPALSNAALQNIFVRLLEEKGLRLADDADRAVRIQIDERRTQSGDEFDNAHAIRRLVDDVLHSYGLRIHGAPTAAGEKTPPIITAADVRNAGPSL